MQLLSVKWLDDSKEDERVPNENEGKPQNDMAADGNADGEGEWVRSVAPTGDTCVYLHFRFPSNLRLCIALSLLERK